MLSFTAFIELWEWVQSQGQKDPLEEEMATHTSILAWRIPWTEEPGGLQFMGSQSISLDWAGMQTLENHFQDVRII